MGPMFVQGIHNPGCVHTEDAEPARHHGHSRHLHAASCALHVSQPAPAGGRPGTAGDDRQAAALQEQAGLHLWAVQVWFPEPSHARQVNACTAASVIKKNPFLQTDAVGCVCSHLCPIAGGVRAEG